MTLQLKVKVSEGARDLTLIKRLCVRVYKKSFFNKQHLAKDLDNSGTAVRFQVCLKNDCQNSLCNMSLQVVTRFPNLDEIVVAAPEGEQGKSLQEEFTSIVSSARELVKTDRYQQELAMPKVRGSNI